MTGVSGEAPPRVGGDGGTTTLVAGTTFCLSTAGLTVELSTSPPSRGATACSKYCTSESSRHFAAITTGMPAARAASMAQVGPCPGSSARLNTVGSPVGRRLQPGP